MTKKIARFIIAMSLAFIGLNTLWVSLQQPATLAKSEAAPIDITVNEVVAGGFSRPVQVTHAGDGSGRLFVVEQDGRIKIISNTTVLAPPFLDINGIVKSPTPGDNGGNEQGLLGVVFHPDYETNGFFYVNYTRQPDGATVVARYSVSGANPNQANSASALILLTVAQPFANHNGGQLFFGPDGYLYAALGDGGSANDPNGNGQALGKLLGKMLRIDVDPAGSPNTPDCGSGNNYSIPASNPFVGQMGCDEIWTVGLRNPWRFSFDRTTGDIFIGDVGQGTWEEVDYLTAGVGGINLGWKICEGKHKRGSTTDLCNTPGLTDPIVEYPNGGQDLAVTGGFIYRGSLYPALTGHYFYADFNSGKIWSIEQTGPNTWTPPALELDTNHFISAFGEDEAGELYVLDFFGGRVLRLQDVNGATPNLTTSTKRASTPHADPGERITYTLRLHNSNGPSGHTIIVSDTIPNGLTYVPGTLQATQGIPNASFNPMMQWQGTLTPSATVTVTYAVTVTGAVTGTLLNEAHLSGGGITPLTLTTGVFVPRPVLTSTAEDFFLPGTQPNSLNAEIPDPNTCDFCHTDPIYNRWRGSMMGQSGRDPLFWAALTVANNDAPNAGEFCLRCHTPKGWLEGRSREVDGSSLQPLDLQAGVACEVCHRMVDPLPSPGDEALGIDATIRANLPATATLPANHVANAMMIVDPADNRRGPFTVTAPHTALRTDFLGQSSQALAESRLCGTCHNIDNPLLSWNNSRNQYWPNETNQPAPSFQNGDLFPIERTFDEWANSEYAMSGVFAPQFAGAKTDGIVRSCQDCHIRRTTGFGAEETVGGLNRDCSSEQGCLPEHDLVGGNTWLPQILQDTRWRLNSATDAVHLNNTLSRAREMLQQAATLGITLQQSGGNRVATVRVYNQTGHKLPTGYVEGRRMWLNLKAYDQGGNLVYESGVYDPNTGVLTADAALKIYEAQQGLTPELAVLLNKSPGESFHFVLNNTVSKDNRIPPRGYTQAAFNKIGLRPEGATYNDGQYWDETAYIVPNTTARVEVTLYYQTASKEYIDFLRSNGGVDGKTVGLLWDTLKSPPEVMVTASIEGFLTYFPIIMKTN